MLPALLFTIATLSFGQNPRLYIVQHSPFMDEARWQREMALIREFDFGGIRTVFGPHHMLTKEKDGLSEWGKRWLDDGLKRISAAGLKLHITLGDDVPEASHS